MKLYVVHTTSSATDKHIYGIYTTMQKALHVLQDLIILKEEHNATIHQYILDEYPACMLSSEEDVIDD